MSKRSNECEFSPKVRERIKQRDEWCIFCKKLGNSGYPPTQIAHYVARSQGGLGVEENGAWVCVVHHQELDNGKNGIYLREYFRNYLKSIYPNWSEQIYRKEQG